MKRHFLLKAMIAASVAFGLFYPVASEAMPVAPQSSVAVQAADSVDSPRVEKAYYYRRYYRPRYRYVRRYYRPYYRPYYYRPYYRPLLFPFF